MAAASAAALVGALGCLVTAARVRAEASEAEVSVPAPFEPVRLLTRASPDPDTPEIEIAVWGRTYLFARGPLPTRIQSQGVDLLHREIAWNLEVDGASRSPVWGPVEVEEFRPDRVRLRSTGRAGSLQIDARTLVEYDGMIRIDLRLAAPQKATLDRFSYELALPSAVAKYFNHHVRYDFDSQRIDRGELARSAGLFPNTARSLSFVPTLFIGNREVGIEWWSESNADWTGSAGFEPLEIGPAQGFARFRVVPIAEALELAAGSEWRHTFAFFPAPMRAPPPNWRATRFTSPAQARRYDRSIGTRFVWIVMPERFDARWHGLPESRPGKKQRELRAKLRRDDVAYIPYGKLTAVPSLHPLVLQNASIWAASDRLFRGTAAAQRRFLEERGWRKGQVFGYAACMAREDYLDWMLAENLRVLREEQLDGLYYDWGAINEPCRRDPRVVDPKRDQVFNYFNVRDFYKRLYQGVKSLDPNALITIHTQGQPRALAAHVDYSFVGEALNVVFRGGHSFQEIRKRPEIYDSDYFALPPGLLDAQLLPVVGGVATLLPEIKHGLDPEHPERGRRQTRAFYAIALVNDAKVWLTNTHAETQIGIFRALDRFGGLENAEVIRWWENQAVVADDDALRVSAYVKDDRALLIVANWSDESVQTRLTLDGEALGVPGIQSILDAESQKENSLPGSGIFRLRVPPRDFRILILQ